MKRRDFLRARDHFTAGIFQEKFAPSIDAVGGNRGNREIVTPNGRVEFGDEKNRGAAESLRADHSEQDPRLFPPAHRRNASNRIPR